eukprot:CAMPEP_0117503410 /NCGR_PEP_ID=MMETSP0784-20121206/24316_1 /TAXON_ID=39447 /ORGANISM="" /LENGTH=411 /DNA_ID=CAMNT_0005298727 /DNA_START=80 /DNA_END=1312 /DNA_ORIENTATION=+
MLSDTPLGCCNSCGGSGQRGVLGPVMFGVFASFCKACSGTGRGTCEVDAKTRGCAQPRGATGFKWIREDNSPQARQERRCIGRLTQLAIACDGYSITTSTDARHVKLQNVNRMINGTRLISPSAGEWPVAAYGPIDACHAGRTTALIWVKGTVLDVAVEKCRSDLRTIAVNAASAYQIGGGFAVGGRHALEESMCVQSTLFRSLERVAEQASQLNVTVPEWAVPQQRDSGDRWHMHVPDDGVAISPFVEIFRQNTYEGYKFEDTVIDLEAVVSVAMPNCNSRMSDSPVDARWGASHDAWGDSCIDPQQDAFYIEQLEQKWRAVFVAAAFYSYADTVVVPDAGCGVFKNGPQVVGAALGRVLRNEFQGRFSEVAIACHNETFVHAAQATFEGREVLPIQTVEDAKGSFSPVS